MRNERGNAMLIILIGVVLFAALSYAVSQSTRGGNLALQQSQDADIQRVLDHFLAVKIAVNKLISTGQCTEKTVRFWHADRYGQADPDYYGDGSNTKCQIYHENGGGVRYEELPASLADPSRDTEYGVFTVRIQDVGQTSSDTDYEGQSVSHDLVMIANVNEQACIEINKKLGIPLVSGGPPSFDPSDHSNIFLSPGNYDITMPSRATGGYVNGAAIIGWNSSRAEEVAGEEFACIGLYENPSGDPYYAFYYTLIAR